MTFEPKMPRKRFYPKSDNIGQMCMLIVKLESGGQQLPVIKENLPENSFNLEKSFLSKKRKTCTLLPKLPFA